MKPNTGFAKKYLIITNEALKRLLKLNARPCQCNCFYKLKTKIALLINLFIPRCPFYTVCFAFRRTGVHPPHSYL